MSSLFQSRLRTKHSPYLIECRDPFHLPSTRFPAFSHGGTPPTRAVAPVVADAAQIFQELLRCFSLGPELDLGVKESGMSTKKHMDE